MLKVKAGVAAVEGGVGVVDTRDCASHLPEADARDRGDDPPAVLDHDVDHVVGELRDVTGAEVVPPAVRERGVEHRLVRDVGLGLAEIKHRRSERLERPHEPLPVLDAPA